MMQRKKQVTSYCIKGLIRQRKRFIVRISGNSIDGLVYTMTHIGVLMVKNEKNRICKDK